MVGDLLPGARVDLESLVRVPSVSAPVFDRGPLQASAEMVAGLLRAAGMPDVQILRAQQDGVPGAPAVVARRPAAPGVPTVLLYAHHDVQPPGDPATWTTPAFEPVERAGRLFGRGAADDKAGIVILLTAIRALGPDSPLGITVFIEGEEEIGSPTFETFLQAHRDLLAADVVVIADSGNWRVGRPALTTSLRGMVNGVIEVATLDHAVHSGMFGGAVPDALTALIRMLDRLWDAEGALAVPGLTGGEADLDYPEADLRVDAGVLDGVRLLGRGSLASRLWTRPSLTITGIDVPSVDTASNTLLPAVRARFSLRLAAGQDPRAAFTTLHDHLQATVPWGARVEVRLGEMCRAWAGDVDGPVHNLARWALGQAYGHAPVHMGIGGSIPFIAQLAEAYPEATVLVTGVEDPATRAHGSDESLHLADFERACLGHALLLTALAGSR